MQSRSLIWQHVVSKQGTVLFPTRRHCCPRNMTICHAVGWGTHVQITPRVQLCTMPSATMRLTLAGMSRYSAGVSMQVHACADDLCSEDGVPGSQLPAERVAQQGDCLSADLAQHLQGFRGRTPKNRSGCMQERAAPCALTHRQQGMLSAPGFLLRDRSFTAGVLLCRLAGT